MLHSWLAKLAPKNNMELDQSILYENVAFIDEYPELRKRVWLRRLARERALGVTVLPKVIQFPTIK